MDTSRALTRVGGDRELLSELVKVFLQEYPKRLTQIRASAADGDCEMLVRAAHTLRGQAAFFGASLACKLALKLEEMGRQGELERWRPTSVALEAELGQIRPVLIALTSGSLL